MEIRRFGSVVYPPGGTFDRERQAWLQWVGIHSGEVRVRQDRQEFTVGAGNHFFMVPGCAYALRFSPRSATRHSWIDLRGKVPAALAGLSRNPASQPMEREQERFMEALLGFKRGPERERDPFFRELAEAFVHDILRQWKKFPAGSRGAAPSRFPLPLVEEWMRERLAESLHLEDLADEAGVTREHLVRQFRKATGQTPMARLWRLRIARARELLSCTGLSLEAIAEQTGFASLHHFSRRIKAETGYPPGEFRARFAGSDRPFPAAPRPHASHARPVPADRPFPRSQIP
ncbi:MAG: helix-turn-helix domain-containing protein [Spirochaetes bacterium]|nr:helix-turn-helix domain-containing protein [Spirochaetota bacterium]